MARNDLQARCVEYMAANDISFSAFAASAGIGRETMRKWFLKRDATLSPRFLVGIAAVLELSESEAIALAGGLTAHDRLAAIGREIGARNLIQNSPDVARREATYARSAASRKGLKHPSAPHQQAMRTRAASGELARTLAKMHDTNVTLRAALGRGLGKRLAQHPTPTREKIREWAAETGAHCGLTPDAVLAVWRRKLQLVGLWAKGGPKPNERRHAALLRRGLIVGGRQRHRFWEDAAAAARIEERDPTITRDSLKRWYSEHHAGCDPSELRRLQASLAVEKVR